MLTDQVVGLVEAPVAWQMRIVLSGHLDSSEADPFGGWCIRYAPNAEYSTTRHDVLKVRVVSAAW